jgi:hypothetical protein
MLLCLYNVNGCILLYHWNFNIMALSISTISRKIGLVTFSLLLLTACNASPKPESIYTQVTEAKLKPGDAIPVPAADSSILSVTGKIGTTNSGDHIEMDRSTIESVGLVDYKVDDPFDKRPTVFRGVLMSQLLDLWKVPADATTLELVALNDYKVSIPISDLRKYPVIFALQQDGQYMLIASRGPAMLVYPYAHFQFDRQKYDTYWVWQIASITVN